jgi:hypothetical protein
MMLCLLLTATEADHGSEGAMDMPQGNAPQTSHGWDVAMSVTAITSGMGAKRPRLFDTDSFPIKVDNCASRTMSLFTQDFFAGTHKETRNHSVLGHAGQRTMITHEGTIQWKFENAKGQARDFTITNSYLVPNSAVQLLLPQL